MSQSKAYYDIIMCIGDILDTLEAEIKLKSNEINDSLHRLNSYKTDIYSVKIHNLNSIDERVYTIRLFYTRLLKVNRSMDKVIKFIQCLEISSREELVASRCAKRLSVVDRKILEGIAVSWYISSEVCLVTNKLLMTLSSEI